MTQATPHTPSANESELLLSGSPASGVPTPALTSNDGLSLRALQRSMLEATACANSPRELLKSLCELYSACPVHQAIYYTRDTTGNLQPQASVGELVNDAAMMAAVSSALKSGLVEVRRLIAPARTLIAMSIAIRRETPHAFAISINEDGPVEAPLFSQLVASHLVLWHVMQASREEQADARDAAALIELLERVLAAPDCNHACRQLCTDLKKHLGCEQVAMGLLDKSGRCRLKAISGVAELDEHSTLAKSMQAAMDEAAMRRKSGQWPPPAEDEHSLVCHQQLSENHRISSLLTAPLVQDSDNVIGVVLATGIQRPEWTNGFLNAAQRPLATLLVAWQGHLQAGPSIWWRKFCSALSHRKGQATALVIFLLMASLFLPVTHHVKCDCQVEPVKRRLVAAPFESVLERCLVKPGEQVRRGQIIARLDGREIRMKKASVEADWQQAVKRRDAAQASRKYSQQRIESLEVKRLEAELQILNRRAGNLEIRSPIDGVIASGDLERTEGAPLSMGELLFEVAPLDQMVIELAVEGDDVSHIESGQAVQVRLNACPQKCWSTWIEQIQPRAEIYDGANVFISEAPLDNRDGVLRPGMKGRAKIEIGKRAFGWVLFHKPWDFVTKRLWW